MKEISLKVAPHVIKHTLILGWWVTILTDKITPPTTTQHVGVKEGGVVQDMSLKVAPHIMELHI